MAASPVFVGTPKVSMVQCVNADGTTAKTLISDQNAASKVVALMATSDDSSARIFRVGLVRSATTYVIGTVSVAANSGTDGTVAATNLMNLTSMPGLPIDSDGQPYILLEDNDTLTVACTTTVTAAKTVSFTAIFGTF